MIPIRSPSPMLKISQSDEDIDLNYGPDSPATPLKVLGGYCETISINICNLLKWLKPF